MDHQNKEDTSADRTSMWPGGKTQLRGDLGAACVPTCLIFSPQCHPLSSEIQDSASLNQAPISLLRICCCLPAGVCVGWTCTHCCVENGSLTRTYCRAQELCSVSRGSLDGRGFEGEGTHGYVRPRPWLST